MSDNQQLYEDALRLWGRDAQMMMLAEECCECAAATLQCVYRGRETYTKMVDEIADVEIMLEQARCVLGNADINAAKARKLDRLRERVREAMGGASCPNCKETVAECACMRNRCIGCGGPVGNITFAFCDTCWPIKSGIGSGKIAAPEAAEQGDS